MAKEVNLKELLVKIIMELYKQEVIVARLEKQGIFLARLLVKNLEIVFDVVGFPRDNTHEYDCRHEDLGAPRDESKKLVDDDCFADDWIKDYYYELTQKLSEEKDIIVTEQGVEVVDANNLHLVQEKIHEYIDWLYIEYDKYKSGEKPWIEYFNNLDKSSGNDDENEDNDDNEL